MDTNAAQFARMGFPWTDAPEEAPLPSRASRKIRKGAPNMAKAKPEFREAGRVGRALTAEEQRRMRHLGMLAEIRRQRAALSIQSRHHGSETALVAAKRVIQSPQEAAERLATREAREAAHQAEQAAKEQAVRTRREAFKRAAEAEALGTVMTAFGAVMADALAD